MTNTIGGTFSAARKAVRRQTDEKHKEQRTAEAKSFNSPIVCLVSEDSISSKAVHSSTTEKKISQPSMPTTAGISERAASLQTIIKEPAKVWNKSFETEVLCAARDAFPCSDISSEPLDRLTKALQQGRECYMFSPALHALLGLCFYAKKRGHDAVESFENSKKGAAENDTALLYTAICAKSLLISVKFLRYQTNAILKFKGSTKADDDSFVVIAKELMRTEGPTNETISSLESIQKAFPLSFAAAAGTAFAIYQASREGISMEAGSRKADYYANKASKIRPASPMVPVLLKGVLSGKPIKNEAQVSRIWPDEEVSAWAKRLFCGDEPLYAKTFFSFPLLAIDEFVFQRSPFLPSAQQRHEETAAKNVLGSR